MLCVIVTAVCLRLGASLITIAHPVHLNAFITKSILKMQHL
uniref:Uncharacterized protein n=1 Tax=Anguilla anguilla TaxID=7936 RepID=A0A0E9VXK6_ANGAN